MDLRNRAAASARAGGLAVVVAADRRRRSLARGARPGMTGATARPRAWLARAAWQAHPARARDAYAVISQSQWWSPAELRELQEQALRELVETAGSTTLYRRRLAAAGVNPATVAIGALRRLRPLEREDLDAEGPGGRRAPGSRGLALATSGSTGSVARVLWPRAMIGWVDAAERRAQEWLGVALGEPRVWIKCGVPVGIRAPWGPRGEVPNPASPARRLGATIRNTRLEYAGALGDRGASAVATRLRRRPPALVQGVSNAIYDVATRLASQGEAPVRACWVGGNHLHEHYREAIESAFRCTAYRRYASVETGLIASECRARRLHVASESVLVEVVRDDGHPAPPGEVGDVLVTTLRNHAAPLIRYRIGDRAELLPERSCPCGRGLPTLRLVGRSDEVLTGAGGASVEPATVVRAVLAAAPELLDFQLIASATDSVEVRVIPRDPPLSRPGRERIALALDRLLGKPGITRVREVRGIELTRAGKHRHVISRAGPG